MTCQAFMKRQRRRAFMDNGMILVLSFLFWAGLFLSLEAVSRFVEIVRRAY